eukprot:scaffold1640_cov161-Amphora_coffeaeformis.AAC.18
MPCCVASGEDAVTGRVVTRAVTSALFATTPATTTRRCSKGREFSFCGLPLFPLFNRSHAHFGIELAGF